MLSQLEHTDAPAIWFGLNGQTDSEEEFALPRPGGERGDADGLMKPSLLPGVVAATE
jgi:hypothetical protein